ncbi:MAG: ATP-binding protein [Opitutaceae bacterium]|nr:ATP-binding protein [Opitutaceae bacterium]
MKYVLTQSTNRKLPETTPRTLKLPLNLNKIVTLVGIRRSGKTWLLYETMRRLESGGVARQQMIHLNFEDDRLFPIRLEELDMILRAHEELYPDFSDKTRHLFFDEIQNVSGWETYVRRLYDNEDVRIFVTGSSSHLLSRELATGLRGRSISFEVFPFSFAEFLTFRGIRHVPYSRASESRLVAALEDYLATGGLPELVPAEPELRPRILKEYVDLVFYRDLVDRYKVSNPLVLRLLLKHCLAQPATLLSVHKLYHDFRSQGFALSKDSLYQYLGYLEESYVLFTLPVAERSLRKRAMQPKKLHAMDWALGYPFVAEKNIDVGRKLESAVFLHWRRRREDLAWMSGEQREIDLVLNDDSPETLVNVAWSVESPATWAREIAALEWAGKTHPDAERVLVAHELPLGRAAASYPPPPGVRLVEAWRYLLE